MNKDCNICPRYIDSHLLLVSYHLEARDYVTDLLSSKLSKTLPSSGQHMIEISTFSVPSSHVPVNISWIRIHAMSSQYNISVI